MNIGKVYMKSAKTTLEPDGDCPIFNTAEAIRHIAALVLTVLPLQSP